MAASDHADLIRRKVQGPVTRNIGAAAGRPELDAMRAAARAAYASAGLKVEMRASDARDLADLTELVAVIGDAMLIVPCRAGDGVEGYIGLSHELAQSLIEKATTGALSALPIEPRRPSSIDMLLCSDFLGRFMEAWREISDGKPTADWISGYAPQDHPVDTALMALHTRDVPYRFFRVELRLEGKRDAQLLTAFPADRHPRRKIEVPVAPGPKADWGKVWRDTVMDTHAALDAVLVQLPIPLKDIKHWKPDDLVDIPAEAMANVTLGRRGGSIVATARLGQAHGHRALRLNALTRDTAAVEIAAETMPSTSVSPPSQLGGSGAEAPDPASDPQDAAKVTSAAVTQPEPAAHNPPDASEALNPEAEASEAPGHDILP